MTRTGYFVRLGVSVLIDVLDFSVGRIPGLGTVQEGVGAVALFVLWGWPGLIYLGELADPTEQIDGFIPTATLIAVGVGMQKGFLFAKKKPAPDQIEGKP